VAVVPFFAVRPPPVRAACCSVSTGLAGLSRRWVSPFLFRPAGRKCKHGAENTLFLGEGPVPWSLLLGEGSCR
jgi:hypothetical protein